MTEERKETRGAPQGNKNAAKPDGGFNAGYSGRCQSREKAAWVKAANANGMKLNAWIREALNRAAEQEKQAIKK